MNIHSIAKERESNEYQSWRFMIDDREHKYETVKDAVGFHENSVALTRILEFQIRPKLMYKEQYIEYVSLIGKVKGFLPLDSANPQKGIEQFYKLLLLQ